MHCSALSCFRNNRNGAIGFKPKLRCESMNALDQQPKPVTQGSSPEAKIRLFRSLFRGREDVYPRRFESRKTNKAGYSPVCANEWIRGVCEKPKIKCTDCPHQRFVPVADEVIRWHLSGRDGLGHDFVMGIYPMLLDETCRFLAVDFDGERWQADAGAFMDTCCRLDVPAALEKSRSGVGAHVWLFFEEPIPAILARKVGSFILTEAMENRPELGFDSYDRLFPNQDTLPKGGFGNLIALPLQKGSRSKGNTLFLNEQFKPHPDQWAYLSSLRKISRAGAEALVHEATANGRVLNSSSCQCPSRLAYRSATSGRTRMEERLFCECAATDSRWRRCATCKFICPYRVSSPE